MTFSHSAIFFAIGATSYLEAVELRQSVFQLSSEQGQRWTLIRGSEELAW